MEIYADDLRDWQSDREKAVQGAEGMVEGILKSYRVVLEGEIEQSWLALVVLSVVVLGLAMVFQKRKDVI